jgi:hypothetical protein
MLSGWLLKALKGVFALYAQRELLSWRILVAGIMRNGENRVY